MFTGKLDRRLFQILFLVLCCMLFALPCQAGTKRILVVGDSWAQGILEFKSFENVLASHGIHDVEIVGQTTALGGSSADQWAANQNGKLDALDQAIKENPSIDIVHLSIGGNDFLKAVINDNVCSRDPEQRKAVWDRICRDIDVLIDRILAQRANVQVLLNDYDYLDPALLRDKCKLAIPEDVTPAILNKTLIEFGAYKYERLKGKARCGYLNHFGLLQYFYGVPPDIPKETVPLSGDPPACEPFAGGNPACANSPEAMPDGVHPYPKGYEYIIDHCFKTYYAQWLGAANQPSSPTLENESLRVQLDPGTGGFRSILDKKSGHEYIAVPEHALMFRLMIPEGDQQWVHVDSAQPQIAINDSTASLTYFLETVSVQVTLTLDEWRINAQLELSNNGTNNIEEINFPYVRGIGKIDGGGFIWPNFWKRNFDDIVGKDLGGDHHTWNELPQKVVSRYPGHLASAWCDYGSVEHGLAIEARHTDFSIVDFFAYKVVEKNPNGTRPDDARRSLDLTTVMPRRVKPGESYTSPPIVISAHPGDWHTVADAHRQFLETWIKKPNRPAKFATAIGWHFYFMKHQDGYTLNTYADLPKMAEASLAAGCPYLLLFGWQTGGHDNNYFYRYVPNETWGGIEALRQGLQQCRALGVEPVPFFNGTLANINMPEHKEFGYKWEAKTRTGHPYYAGDWERNNFDAPTRNRSMLHTEIAFCKEQQAYFLDTAKRIVQDYGFGNLQLDQISEKMFVDYNEDHIITTPDRVYVDGLANLLPGVRELVREVNPEGIMIGEALNEFTAQWCDSFWDWNILLPFPDPILYTLPWVMGSHEIDALEFGEVNKAFAYKMHLDMKIDGGDSPITKYPQFTKHVRSLAELRRRTAEFSCFADFRDQEGIEVDAPKTVLAKVYRNNESRCAGIVLAETAGQSATVAVKTSMPLVEDSAILDSNLRDATTVAPVTDLSVDLAPYEVAVVCLKTRKE